MRSSQLVARRLMRAIVSVSVLALATTAFAQTANIVGLGAATCREFNRDVQRNFHIQRDYFAWAQGFMSGLLMRAPAGKDEGVQLVPPNFPLLKQVDFLREFCIKNPNKDYSDGAIELYRMLRGEQRTDEIGVVVAS